MGVLNPHTAFLCIGTTAYRGGDPLQTIRNMYRHLNWANQRIVEALQQCQEGSEPALDLFSHILHSEQV